MSELDELKVEIKDNINKMMDLFDECKADIDDARSEEEIIGLALIFQQKAGELEEKA